MSSFVIAAVQCAALLHAGWNTLAKAHGGAPATILISLGAGLVCTIGLPFAPMPHPASWHCIGARR